MRSYATRQIAIGLALAAVGGLISLASYQAASENGGGGYVVFWGAVVFGVLMAFRGVRLYMVSGPDLAAVTRPWTSTSPKSAPPARPLRPHPPTISRLGSSLDPRGTEDPQRHHGGPSET
jgi:hypothetical protein